jgi:hypothetical protein
MQAEQNLICEPCSKEHLICGLDIDCSCCKKTLLEIHSNTTQNEYDLLIRYLIRKKKDDKK